MSKEIRVPVKPVMIKPGTMYRLFKVHKQEVYRYHPFRLILLALQTPNYNFVEFSDRILKCSTENKDNVQDSFHFVEEICEQDFPLSTRSLDVDLFSTNIVLDETIDRCVNRLTKNTDTVPGFTKSEHNQCLAAKEFHFTFNDLL